MAITFLLAGLFVLTIAGLFLFSEAEARRDAVEVPAELAGFSTGQSATPGARFFYAVARYQGLDGQTRYLESTVGSSVPLGAVGDRLSVLVHRGDPAKAALKSSLPFVLGGVLAAMGAACCVVFFSVFRITPFSILGAVAVVGLGAWKLQGALRDSPVSETWSAYKRKLRAVRVFTEATRGEIRWVDPAALQAAERSAQKSRRVAIPVLVLAGAALIALGAHLHRSTAAFLERAVQGTGTVVELVANHSGDGVTWAPVVEFEHGGRRLRFKDSVSSNPPSWRAGDAVAVLYDPARPADARIDRGRWNQAIPVLIGAFGALLCSLGVWMGFRRGRSCTTAG